MSEEPEQAEVQRWRRYFAASCNNRAWDLISRAERTPDEMREMVDAAHAAAYHWAQVGTPLNAMRADVTLAFAYARSGDGERAGEYGRRSLDFCESNPCEDWDIAFAHAAIALAAAVAGDAPLHARHMALAQQTGAAIMDDDDREVFLAELARVPVDPVDHAPGRHRSSATPLA